MPWLAAIADDGTRYVLPIDDLRPHEHGPECWCQPIDNDGVFVHNSLDRREEYERGRRVS